MRVLVSGGAGFIGSHVIHLLASGGHDVIAVDLPPAVDSRIRAEYDDRIRWIAAEPDDVDTLIRAAEGVEAVCDHGFRPGAGNTFNDLPWHVRNNDGASAHLMTALHRSGFDGRIVLGSSVSVYGDGKYRCAEHGHLSPGPRRPDHLEQGRFEPACPICNADLHPVRITEDSEFDPRSVTAASRVHQEYLWRAFALHHELPLTVLRAHHVYGPHMARNAPLGGVAGVFRSQIDAGVRPQVYEDGGQTRDFIHVADVARATELATTATLPHRGPLHVASGRTTTLLEVATTLCIARDSRLWPEVIGHSVPGDARHLLASPDRAREALGFRARITLQDGLSTFAHAPLGAPHAAALVDA